MKPVPVSAKPMLRRFGPLRAPLLAFGLVAGLLTGQRVAAAVVRVEVTQRGDWLGGQPLGKAGAYEWLQGRVFYAVAPNDPANRAIADVALAPRNAAGLVEFSGDFLLLRPKDPAKARGTVLVEAPNRGNTQLFVGFFEEAAGQRFILRKPSALTGLRDAFLFEEGFTVAWVGWQYDVTNPNGLSLAVPTADVSGWVRAASVGILDGGGTGTTRAFSLKSLGGFCASDTTRPGTELTVRTRFDGPPTVLPRTSWSFAREDSGRVAPDPCSVRLAQPLESAKVYELVYPAQGSPVAGLGFAAVRDFVAYVKHGGPGDSTLRAHPQTLQTVLGFGYSQSARFLRNFLYDGFNADEAGRRVFDGLLVASAGAGRGDFNHRFAVPGEAGNSVLSVLRPVDLFPFTDAAQRDPLTGVRDGLLARAEAQGVTPKIFHTYTSTEYWARVGSLAHTTPDGLRDVPLPDQTRLYFIAGTPHAGGFAMVRRNRAGDQFANLSNVGYWQQFALRALLLNLDEWVKRGVPPPPPAYPTRRANQLALPADLRFPKIPAVDAPTYLPTNWRMDFGPDYRNTGVATLARPRLGAAYTVLVPRVNADGNETSGVQLPHVTVPLATYTGWNFTVPRLEELGYMAGLVGSAIPLARTAEERAASGDPRPSLAERYATKDDYLARVRAATAPLIQQRLMRGEDVDRLLLLSGQLWDQLTAAQPGK